MPLLLRASILCCLLVGVWALLSGKFDALHLGFGIAAAVVITFVTMPALSRSNSMPWLRFFAFIPWHVYQVILSNLRVAGLVLRRNPPIKPTFVVTRPGLSGDQALTMLGFGVTLTPGTLTIDIDETSMLIHALDEASAKDIRDKTMAKRVAEVFGGSL